MELGSTASSREEERRERRSATALAVADFQRGMDREGAFARLYAAFSRPIRNYFRRKGFGADEAQDLTQETFLRVYQALEGYEERERFEAWLFRVAETCRLKRLRASATAKRSGVEISTDDETRESASLARPETQLRGVLDEERRERLAEAVRDLPGQMRRCLTLRLYRDLSYREIATVMRLNVETVKAHLFRARKKLAEELGDPVTRAEEP